MAVGAGEGSGGNSAGGSEPSRRPTPQDFQQHSINLSLPPSVSLWGRRDRMFSESQQQDYSLGTGSRAVIRV